MRLIYSVGFVLLALSHNAYCQRNRETASSQAEAPPEPSHAQSLDVVANSVTNLAQKISLAIASQKSKTEIFSPVSIAGALSLLLLGSGGTTKDELMKLMGFQNEQISFTEIHKSFGKLFRELVSNDPTLQANVPWRETDKCNIYDDDEYESRGSFRTRPKRDSSNPVEVSIGNGIFAQDGRKFDAKYEKLADQLYQSELKYLDFAQRPQQAVSVINNWVRNQTRGKIPEIVSSLNSDTLLVIANTLFFKAEWDTPFLKDGTKIKKFFPNGPNAAPVEVEMMMHGGCFPYYYWREADTKVLGFPYKKNNTMYVFLPNDSDRNKVRSVQSRMSASILNDIIQKMEVKSASVQFPKMHLVNSFNLKAVLDQLGAYSIFDRDNSDLYRVLSKLNRGDGAEEVDDIFDLLEDTEENAILELKKAFEDCDSIIEKDVDTYETCEKDKHCRYGGGTCVCCLQTFGSRKRRDAATEIKEPLYVNEVIHKVDVVVNEKGTEGGAVTVTLLDRITSLINFRVTGPFLMIIRDEMTKLPLFYGTVYDPST